MRWCGIRDAILACVVMLLLPAAAYAQSSISGTARDTSDAVLPGVTVEAASPALIQKIRTAVTDTQGRYIIVDLPPGVYSVTFTLGGFRPVRQEGVQLAASFNATVNAVMSIGADYASGNPILFTFLVAAVVLFMLMVRS